MKKILLIISCIIVISNAVARSPLSLQWRPSELSVPPGGLLQGIVYDYNVFLSDGTLRGSLIDFRVKEATAALTLFTNPYLATLYADAYSVDIRYKIVYKDLLGIETRTEQLKLHIDYDPERGSQYQSKDSYYVSNVHYATVIIDSVVAAKSDGTPLDLTSLNDLFYLRFQLDVDSYYKPDRTVAPAIQLIKHSQDYGQIKFSWYPLKWAKQYDVEWTYVDDFNASDATSVPRSDLSYHFRNNSTRVTVSNTEYEIPLVFERGYVLFRVRGVGFWGDDLDRRIVGVWSMPDAGTEIPPVAFLGSWEVPNGVFQINALLQHEVEKNWQYTTSFSEEGKRVDVIQYSDGTLRNRQALTNISSTKHLMVGETLYDHQGRPAVEILPSPVTLPSVPYSTTRSTYYTAQPSLKFIPLYNVSNAVPIPYRQEHFDKDNAEGCDLQVQPLHSSSGSGNYYSPSNPDQTGHQAYVPDAHGYPFSHIEYTPDKTGRIRRQGQVGEAFQLGSGHEMKYFYATPSQQEIDRVFGNEAGMASHYKKDMMIDPNGQTHVSYKDSKGQVIATALAGAVPENLQAISIPSPQRITLNLLEEENRREAGSASLVASRSLTISQLSTVEFQYQLTPASYSINTCPAEGPICYDCVYDLSIQVYDDCGTELYNVSQSIGTLEGLRNCSATPFTTNNTLSLRPGSYTVSKRLTVNSQSIDHYMEDYLGLTCFRDLLRDLTDRAESEVDPTVCETPCNACAHTQLEASYTVLQADGSERTINIPVEVRNTNDGTCVNTCSTCAGGCNVYYESILADMSPNGQYAQYRDTTRRDVNPLGEVYPRAFPVSILNEENNLPAQEASWRRPVFDYRNAKGEIAYIEINEAGQPAHLEIEIMVREGKRYVKPQYLNNLEDFVAYWQPSWAESLAPYHPEYHYYLWCKQQKRSHEYDSTMRATKTYSAAAALDLVNHRALGLVNDPFFQEHPGAVAMMMDSLNSFFTMDTLSRPSFNIDETTYLVINCNNINFDEAEVVTCARGMSLYANPARANKEWELYKQLYLSMKLNVMNVVRHRDVIAAGGFNNMGIGHHSSLVRVFPVIPSGFADYDDKTRRFVDVQDAFTYRQTNPMDSGDPEYADNWRSFLYHANQAQYQRCGTCPVASDFLALVNGFTQEKRLTETVDLPDAPPLTLTRSLVDAFSIHDALSYSWNPSVSGNQLKVEIKAKGTVVCSFEMIQEGESVDWEDIRFFISISEAGSSNKFRLRGLTTAGKEVMINGYSTCLDITKCKFPPVCKATPLLHDMKVFMNYLLTNKRYQQTSLRIHTAGENTPYFGQAFQEQHPDFKTWDWQFTGLSAGIYTGEIVISKPGDGILSLAPVIQTCKFNFRPENGYGLSDVFGIVEIRQATPKAGDKKCERYDFVLVAINGKGIRFTIHVGNTCYSVSDCCKQIAASCNIPFTPVVPFVNTCFENALGLARENAKRKFDDSVQSVGMQARSQYIEHCLNAAEQFRLTYSEQIYHYTLYYYDQSGNLVQTVPPKGVAVLDDDELSRVASARITADTTDNVYPQHQFRTTYQYNTLNQVVRKSTPDGNVTNYCYDELGRVILSQTAQQAANSTCSYMLYDALGKVIETGKLVSRPGTFPHTLNYTEFNTTWLAGMRSEIFKTHYNQPLREEINTWFNNKPLYTRNRVAAVTYQESAGGTYDHATHYRYDVIGNVSELIQENAAMIYTHPAVAEKGHHIKRVQYEYDLVSGNVNRIVYQPNQPDQFIHEYAYDADNRLIHVKTSTNQHEDELVKDIDAAFSYYKHGPLARQTLGMEKVQGLDIAYTLQGWLKGINATTLSPYRDIGRDATTTGAASSGVVAQDAFGYSLGYFGGDYQPIGAGSIGDADMFTSTIAGSELDAHAMYNGNISHLVIGNDAFSSNKVQAQTFRYDQLNRLTGMQIFQNANVMTSNAWSGGSLVPDYQTTYNYDANGNITHLTRNDGAGSPLDDLTYNYDSRNINNQLMSVSDGVTTEDPSDLETQATDNYAYDRDGRLKTDLAAGITAMDWNNADKIKQIQRADGTINFAYDAQGRRVTKTTSDYTTYDVLDNTGNVLASYQIKNDTITWKYTPLYSDKRMGVYSPNKVLTREVTDTANTQIRGLKQYELTGHSGNVLATVTDRKVPSTLGSGTFYPDISSAQDYYPFGMTMTDRSLDTIKYAFGFQGMMQDDDVKGNGNSYTTEFRQYDPRVGRWLSVDPVYKDHESPYTAFFNNPIYNTDPLGNDPPEEEMDLTLDFTLTIPDNPDVRICPECSLELDLDAEDFDINPSSDDVRGVLLDILIRENEGGDDILSEHEPEREEEPAHTHDYEGRLVLGAPYEFFDFMDHHDIPSSIPMPPLFRIPLRVDMSIYPQPLISTDPLSIEGGTVQGSFGILPPRPFVEPERERHDDDHEHDDDVREKVGP